MVPDVRRDRAAERALGRPVVEGEDPVAQVEVSVRPYGHDRLVRGIGGVVDPRHDRERSAKGHVRSHHPTTDAIEGEGAAVSSLTSPRGARDRAVVSVAGAIERRPAAPLVEAVGGDEPRGKQVRDCDRDGGRRRRVAGGVAGDGGEGMRPVARTVETDRPRAPA